MGAAVRGQLAAVCGDAPVTEDAKPDPVGFYGIGKLAAEMYVRKSATEAGCDYAIMRIGNAYGPGQLEDNLSMGFVARAVETALQGGELEVWGADEIYRDYIHAEDVAEAFRLAAECPAAMSGIYNVGQGLALSNSEVISVVERALGKTVKVIDLPRRPFDVRRIGLYSAALQQRVGWRPAVSLAEGVAAMAAWLAERGGQFCYRSLTK